MKTLKVIYLLLVVLLAFGLFAGCDNGTTSDNDDFVLIPVDPIDPPYANIPTLDNYDTIFMGEDHTNRENFGVYLNLVKYYYSLGVRDFAIEAGGYGHTLLLQYYIESGNEECLELLFKNTMGTAGCSVERYNFFKDIYRWNSTLKQKIRLYDFDVAHDSDSAVAAIFFIILRKYPRIEGIPSITTPGYYQELVSDFKNNKARYSSINAEDLKLFERIIANLEQAFNYYPSSPNESSNDVLREQYMIENFRQIRKDTKGRKIFAIMGWVHADLKGTDTDGPPAGFTMASRLKNEIRIASVVLRQQPDTDRWQYNIGIDETKKTTPFNSTYNGNWPWSLGYR
jgi:hypothetical protein